MLLHQFGNLNNLFVIISTAGQLEANGCIAIFLWLIFHIVSIFLLVFSAPSLTKIVIVLVFFISRLVACVFVVHCWVNLGYLFQALVAKSKPFDSGLTGKTKDG